eukprot:Gb_10473 [translate_table: standard]
MKVGVCHGWAGWSLTGPGGQCDRLQNGGGEDPAESMQRHPPPSLQSPPAGPHVLSLMGDAFLTPKGRPDWAIACLDAVGPGFIPLNLDFRDLDPLTLDRSALDDPFVFLASLPCLDRRIRHFMRPFNVSVCTFLCVAVILAAAKPPSALCKVHSSSGLGFKVVGTVVWLEVLQTPMMSRMNDVGPGFIPLNSKSKGTALDYWVQD